MQNANAPQAPSAPQAPQLPRTQQGTEDASDLGAEIRQQIREQVQAAREQAQAARAGQATTVGVPAPPPPGTDTIPPEAVTLGIAFFIMIAVIAIGAPIARAWARRFERKSMPQLDAGLATQLQRIEQSVEAVAIEVERISEAQRYMARLQSERGEAVPLPREGSRT